MRLKNNLYSIKKTNECAVDFMKIAAWARFVLCLCTLGLLLGCSTQKTIINGLDERDSNEILVLLSTKGIEAQKVRAPSEGAGGSKLVLWNIVVEAKDATEAMGILNASGLPRRKESKLLEIFSTGGLVPSEMQEKIRYRSGLAEQIASTIRKIDGIVDADIQLSFPEEDPLNPQKTLGKVTASVFVKHTGVLDDPNSHLITKIRRLVTSSVQGLDYDNVTVVPVRAQFSGIPTTATKAKSDVELIKVWTVAVAKDSVMRFQVIFIGALFLLLLAFAILFWFVWRMMPLIREEGIIPALFSKKSFAFKEEEKKVQETQAEVEGESKNRVEQKTEQNSAQENIEE